jgi:transposase
MQPVTIHSPASDDLDARVLALFRSGLDTMAIAVMLDAHEEYIYRALHRARNAEKAREAGR